MEKLKQKHFPHNPDEPVILHRKDIINRIGPFWRLRDEVKEKAFDDDLLGFFKEHPTFDSTSRLIIDLLALSSNGSPVGEVAVTSLWRFGATFALLS